MGRKVYALVPESELARTMAKSHRDGRFWLHQQQYIGRAANKKNGGITIPNDWTQFSSMHCRVFAELQPDQSWAWWVEDSSTNGTWVNERKCDKGTRVQLQAGDTLRLSVTGAGAPTLEFKFVQEEEQVEEADGRGDNYSSGAQKRRLSSTVDVPDTTPTKRPNAPSSGRTPHTTAHEDAASPGRPAPCGPPQPSPGTAAAAAVAGLKLQQQPQAPAAAPAGQAAMSLDDAAGMYKANNVLRKKVDKLAAERDAAGAAADAASKRLIEEQAVVAELRHKLVEQEGGFKAQIAELTARLAAEQEARSLDAAALASAKAAEEAARTEGQRVLSELWQLRAEAASKQGLLDSLGAQVCELEGRAREADAAATKAQDEVRSLREEVAREQTAVMALRARESELSRERDARACEADGVREELERLRAQLAAEAGGGRELQAALERAQMDAEGRAERLALKALAEQHALDAAVALQSEMAVEVQRLVSGKLSEFIQGPMQRLRAIDALELMATQMGTYPAAPAPSGAAPAGTATLLAAGAAAAAAAMDQLPLLPPLPPAATQTLGLGFGLAHGLRGANSPQPSNRSGRSAAPAPTTGAAVPRGVLDAETQVVDMATLVAAARGAPPLLPPGWQANAVVAGVAPQLGQEADSPLQGKAGAGGRMEEDGAEGGEGQVGEEPGVGQVGEGNGEAPLPDAGTQVEGGIAAASSPGTGRDEGMEDAQEKGPEHEEHVQPLEAAGVAAPASAAAAAQQLGALDAGVQATPIAPQLPLMHGSSELYQAAARGSPNDSQQPRLSLAAALSTPGPSSRTTSREPACPTPPAEPPEHSQPAADGAAAIAAMGGRLEEDQVAGGQDGAHDVREGGDAQMQDAMATEPQDRDMHEDGREMGEDGEEEELGGDEESLPHHNPMQPHAPYPTSIFGADASETQGQGAVYDAHTGSAGVAAAELGALPYGVPAGGMQVLSDRSNSYARPVSQEQGGFIPMHHMSTGKAGSMPPSLQNMM